MTMPADRETIIEELFHAALDREPKERGAFLGYRLRSRRAVDMANSWSEPPGQGPA